MSYYHQRIQYLLQFVTPERWSRIQHISNQRTRAATVVFEHIHQPLNMSAALRTLECLGVQNVSLVDRDSYPSLINTGITKGAESWLTVKRYRSQDDSAIATCFEDLKKSGYTIMATTPHAEGVTPLTIDASSKLAVVFGNEEHGISSYVKDHADGFLTIPMYGFTESFNISVSVGIVMSTLVERLRCEFPDWKLSEDEINELQYLWLKKGIRASAALEERFLDDEK